MTDMYQRIIAKCDKLAGMMNPEEQERFLALVDGMAYMCGYRMTTDSNQQQTRT